MNDLSRYSRQVVLREVGVNGQQLLRDSSALIVGLGGLGSVAALYLAGAGLGKLLLCDRDRVDASNLQRQILYSRADVGRLKIEAACERLASLNGDVALETLAPEGIEAAINTADVVLDCTDNFPSRFKLNELCAKACKPLVSGAAIRFEGQLAVFDFRKSDSPCYACLYPSGGEAQETCEEAGILGPVAGVIGSAQALASLQLLLGLHDNSGKLRLWNARTMEWKTLNLKRDPQCKNHF
ncbi:MAG: molybdopterin-synthase adenylyltransferase MoeB [Pseudomonadota bacterium]